MKYRLLTKIEREEFREEFIQYLSSNTITATDWFELQKNNVAQADDLFARFSDIVFQKVYEKIMYLQVIGIDYAAFYGVQKNETLVYILQVERKENGINYSEDEIKNLLVNQLDKCVINVYRKQFSQERESVIHELLENGANSCDGEIFLQLQAQIKTK